MIEPHLMVFVYLQALHVGDGRPRYFRGTGRGILHREQLVGEAAEVVDRRGLRVHAHETATGREPMRANRQYRFWFLDPLAELLEVLREGVVQDRVHRVAMTDEDAGHAHAR